MSGRINLLAGAPPATSTPTSSIPALPGSPHSAIRQQVISNYQQLDEQNALRQRDVAGREMAHLARLMDDPDISRTEIADDLQQMVAEGDLTAAEGAQILGTLPAGSDRNTLRQWAQMMFTVALHNNIHGHAAYPRELFPGNPQHQTRTWQQPPQAQAGAPEDMETPSPAPEEPS
jgi:hypothetical protein